MSRRTPIALLDSFAENFFLHLQKGFLSWPDWGHRFGGDVSVPFAALPDEAIEVIRTYDGPVIVDFDLTLYRRISTTDFLATATPPVAAKVLVRLVDRWGEMRNHDSALRDGRRVRAVRRLLPRALRRWPDRAAELAASGANERILSALTAGPPDREIVVATLGFDTIVGPMVAAMLPESNRVRLVAVPIDSPGRRLDGKLAMVRDAIGEEAIAEATLVTDSLDDRDLLEVVARPLLVEWPESRPPSVFGPLG